MSKDLVPFKVSNLPIVAPAAMNQLAEVSKGANFLSRIQLIGKGKYVDTKKIGPGSWGIPLTGGEEITDLGEQIDIIPFTARPKALDVSDKGAIIAVYDTEDPEYQRIKNAPKNTGCMWGPCFLVLERTTGKMYELFFSNASGRSEAGKLNQFLPQEGNPNPRPATLSIRYKKGKDFSYHVPVVTKCSEPFDPSKCPKPEEITEAVTKFLTVSKSVESVPEGEEPKGRAR